MVPPNKVDNYALGALRHTRNEKNSHVFIWSYKKGNYQTAGVQREDVDISNYGIVFVVFIFSELA